MVYEYNVSNCETNYKKWTPTAIDCYKIGCNCSKCNLYKLFFSTTDSKCMMKFAVFGLVRNIGAPNLEEENHSEKGL